MGLFLSLIPHKECCDYFGNILKADIFKAHKYNKKRTLTKVNACYNQTSFKNNDFAFKNEWFLAFTVRVGFTVTASQYLLTFAAPGMFFVYFRSAYRSGEVHLVKF